MSLALAQKLDSFAYKLIYREISSFENFETSCSKILEREKFEFKLLKSSIFVAVPFGMDGRPFNLVVCFNTVSVKRWNICFEFTVQSLTFQRYLKRSSRILAVLTGFYMSPRILVHPAFDSFIINSSCLLHSKQVYCS